MSLKTKQGTPEFYPKKVGRANIFKDFSAEGHFRFMNYGSPEGVMISLEGTDESSLSDGTYKLSIRTVIGQFHSS